MVVNAPRLYYLSILSHSGKVIYEQYLGKQPVDPETVDKIVTVTLGFKNTMDLTLSSVNYEHHTIYFRQGGNFLAVILANRSAANERVIDRLFSDMVQQQIMGKFIEAAHNDTVLDDELIEDKIRRIMYNLDFITSILSIKQELHKTAPRYSG